ncbi:hypothetical protein CN914_21925, partial [Bacillus thuringiensis]
MKKFSFNLYAGLAVFVFRCLAPATRLFGGFASSYKAKSASTSEAPSPSQSKRAASAFHCPSPAARLFGGF